MSKYQFDINNFKKNKGELINIVSQKPILCDSPFRVLAQVIEDDTRMSCALLPIKPSPYCWWIYLAQSDNMPKIYEKIDFSKSSIEPFSQYKNLNVFAVGYQDQDKNADKTMTVFHFSKPISYQDILSSFHMLGIKVYKIYDTVALADGSLMVLTEVVESPMETESLMHMKEKIILEKFEIEISTIAIIGSYKSTEYSNDDNFELDNIISIKFGN